MKFCVTFKTPDAGRDEINDAVERYIDDLRETVGIRDEEEEDELHDATQDKLQSVLRKWLRDGEYVTLEFDSLKGTCTVVKP